MNAVYAHMVVDTPTNPVNIGDPFIFRCAVSGLSPEGDVVQIRRDRADGSVQMLTYQDIVFWAEHNRVYLSVKRLEDGSTVYLLTILHTSSFDEGTYVCQVLASTEGMTELIEQRSVDLRVYQYPDDTELSCSPIYPAPDQLNEGQTVSMLCSAPITYPNVDLTWRVISPGNSYFPELVKSTTTYEGDNITSRLTVNAAMENQGVSFVCELTSRVFPDRLQSCYVDSMQLMEIVMMLVLLQQ